jgi:hypothetical protein
MARSCSRTTGLLLALTMAGALFRVALPLVSSRQTLSKCCRPFSVANPGAPIKIGQTSSNDALDPIGFAYHS